MSTGSLWRYTAQSPRFLFVDASATYPLLLFLGHMRGWTLIISLLCIVGLWLLERQGMTPKGVFNYLRAAIGQWLGGGVRAESKWSQLQRRNIR